MAKITGRVEVYVNGNLLLNKSGAKASGIGISGKPSFERTTVIGDTGVHGYLEKPVPARCEVTVTDRSDISLSYLAERDGDATIIFQTAGGKSKKYVMEGATCLNNFTLTAGEGEVSNVVFEGPFWTEQGTTASSPVINA